MAIILFVYIDKFYVLRDQGVVFSFKFLVLGEQGDNCKKLYLMPLFEGSFKKAKYEQSERGEGGLANDDK